jgi:trehalose-phosphatase
MDLLRPGFRPDDFFARLAAAPARALLVDFDGTLAPFRDRRDLVRPWPGVRAALEELRRTGTTRLVVVTGRSVEDVEPLLGLAPQVWGAPGGERRLRDGALWVRPLPPGADAALEAAWSQVLAAGWEQDAERKSSSVALHWRALPAEEGQRRRAAALERWEELAAGGEVAVTWMDCGMELRVTGHDKGDAVRWIFAELGADAAVAYLGDDLTDEDAFRALAGRGLGVLVRPEPRETAADVWLRPPDELLTFLERWTRACPEAVDFGRGG